jgi:hypothetical protein
VAVGKRNPKEEGQRSFGKEMTLECSKSVISNNPSSVEGN